MNNLKTLLKTTPRYISILANNWINTIQDFLQYFPRAYEDRSNIRPLDQLIFNEKWITSTKAKIISKTFFAKWNKKIYNIKFEDINWNRWNISIFNSWYLASQLKEDQRYIIVWKPTIQSSKITFSHPDIVPAQAPEKLSQEQETFNTGRIYPIYPELNGISPWRFASKIWNLINHIPNFFEEYLPEQFIKNFELLWVIETIKQIHFPDNMKLQQKAIQRIFFDRLLRVQLHWLINRLSYQWQSKKILSTPHRDTIKHISDKLPFSLTTSQKKVIKEMIENIHDSRPMLRLLQWDVWSGKTIVAAIWAYYTHHIFRWQSVFLAPLEVLAQQHYQTLAKFLLPLWIRIELLTWSITKSQKEKIKSDLIDGHIQILIGTHAILQDTVQFKDLQLVIIDEQHKFWVKQRAFLKKFNNPHILQMSATPIPRSMALAFFGEFDVSIIDELPQWRKPIITKIISESEYIKLKPRILSKINQWQRVFIVTPLIEESEKMDELKSATIEFQETIWLYPELNWKIWLLHGKMKAQEKEKIMQEFKSWKISILISTTVIEVWVDVPQATIMIIKNSERFWISQLHQLRGRIWRSDLQSYCFLETNKKSWDSYTRLKSLEETQDWFKLAELDLQNRWSWEILWTMQSWESDIPINILSDLKFIEKVQQWAIWLLENYPNLNWLDKLKNYLNKKIWNIIA